MQSVSWLHIYILDALVKLNMAASISEISHMKGPTISWIKVLLNVFDYITLVVFVMEIVIKWIDGFWVFWKNGWNNFDFFVTAMVGRCLHARGMLRAF